MLIEFVSLFLLASLLNLLNYYVDESVGIKAFRSANVRRGFINDSDWVYFSQGHLANKKVNLKRAMFNCKDKGIRYSLRRLLQNLTGQMQ